MIVLYPWGKADPTSVVPQGTPVAASITTTNTGPCLAQGQVQVGDQSDPNAKPCLTVDLTMTDGPANGKQLKLTVPIEPSTPRFAAGDAVVLAYNGGNATDPASFQLVDFQRGTPLLVLAALFAVAVLVLGRWQGLAALVALGPVLPGDRAVHPPRDPRRREPAGGGHRRARARSCSSRCT